MLGALGGACNASNSGSGGTDGGQKAGECVSCGEAACPDESAACDASANCRKLRSCSLGCSTDACHNDCVAEVSDDAEALVAATNFLACATLNCEACSPELEPGDNGSGGSSNTASGSGGGSSNTSTTAGSNTTGSGGSSNPTPPRCDDLLDWAVGCVADGNSQVTACNDTPLSQCRAACHIAATCNEYEETQSGVSNDLSACLTACDVAYGGATDPTCANAQGKRVACGITVERECSDSSTLDRCFNECIMDHDCAAITDTLPQGMDNPFIACYDACEANNSTSPNFVVDDGGYVTTSSWQGYAWTATDEVSATTIIPADFSDLTAGSQLCASGTVAGTADYSAVAMLGINLSQEVGDPAPDPGIWNPSGEGITYNISNFGGTPLRIQIQGPDGDSDSSQRWCAEVTGQSGSIFWHTFNTECWEGGLGTEYPGAGSLESIMVLVPGDLDARSFDFCIYELGVL